MSVIISGDAFVAGLALGSASVLSIGPNSLMMIREGLARGRTGLVASVVLISEASLLGLAYVAAGTLSMDVPFLQSVLSRPSYGSQWDLSGRRSGRPVRADSIACSEAMGKPARFGS